MNYPPSVYSHEYEVDTNVIFMQEDEHEYHSIHVH